MTVRDQSARRGVVTVWVDARQVMSRCQLGDQGVIAVGDGGWAYDQPTLRIAGKRCDGVLDFAGIVNTSFTYFDREGRSGGLGGAQHGDIAGDLRKEHDSNPRDARRDLLKDFQPFAANRGLVKGEAGDPPSARRSAAPGPPAAYALQAATR